MFEGLLQPTHLLDIGIITILLFGKRLPEIARIVGRNLVELGNGCRKLIRTIPKNAGKSKRHPNGWNDEEPGGCLARLDPPDKPRPPAQVALTPPRPEAD